MRTKALIGFLLFSKLVVCQVPSQGDIFQDKLYAYAINHPSQTLFIHFDKNIYVGNENAWFAAYILRPDSLNDILSISLINHNSRRIIKTEQFSILNGCSAGKISLPDTLASGEYDLVGITDLIHNNKPVDIFIQRVEIRSPYRQEFTVALTPDPSPVPKHVTVRTTKKDLTAAPDVDIEYTITYRKGFIRGKGRTDKTGLYNLLIPDSLLKQTLYFSVEAGLANLVQHSALVLNDNTPRKLVRFFPEGGKLVDRIPSKVGVEITGTDGSVSSTRAILYSGGQPIDTIVTDENGMAVIQVMPEQQSKLFVKIQAGEQFSDFNLPDVLPTGVSLRLEKGLVSSQLRISLTASGKGRYHVIVHNFREAFGIYNANFSGRSSTTIQASLADVPRGLATITVLDESGNPVAERMFYAHSDQKAELTISSDQLVYASGQPIKLSVKTAATGTPSGGIISIACVNSNRINPLHFTNIDSYSYLNHEINHISNIQGVQLKDSAILEKIMLIKGWRRYDLNSLVKTKESDTLARLSKISYKGLVQSNSGKVRKTNTISVFKDSSVAFLFTDDKGSFDLPNENLFTNSASGNVSLVVNDNKSKEYSIKISDPYQSMLQSLIDSIYTNEVLVQKNLNKESVNGRIESMDNTTILNSVVVSSRSSRESRSMNSGLHANACGDFVCVEGNLNCPVHKPYDNGSYLPVKGKRYHIFAFQGGKVVYIESKIYSGCTIEDLDKQSALTMIQGIKGLKDYYMPIEDNAQQPAKTTLYWESLKQLNFGEEYSTSLKGDKPGSFIFIVQGIFNNKPVFQEIKIAIQ